MLAVILYYSLRKRHARRCIKRALMAWYSDKATCVHGFEVALAEYTLNLAALAAVMLEKKGIRSLYSVL
jgi:hypothetical protein